MKKLVLLSIGFFLLLSISVAQKKKVKFGKVSKEDLLMKYYEPDSSANAVVLYDKAIWSTYVEGYERHTIIKILKNEGKRIADIRIPLIGNGTLNSFKAVTYNYENGTIVKTKVKFKDLIKEKTFKQITTIKGAFPNVKEGSVIEISYSTYSILSWNWYFQYDDIPVKYSEFSLILPETAHIHISERGFANVNTHYKKDEPSSKVTYNWYAEDIPAFKTEEYITTSNDFKKKVEFELSYLNSGGIVYYDKASSWEEIDKDLHESFYFGDKIKESKFLNKKVDTLFSSNLSDFDKMLKIYQFVQNELHWIGYKNKYSYRTYREIFNKKNGNSSGEINLALISLLNSHGFKVMPVILSTRDNGRLYPDHPTIDKFNYVIASVKIEGKEYFLDATEELLPAGLLPKRCLNWNGRKVYKQIGELIDIKPVAKDKTFSMYMVNLVGEKLNGAVQKLYSDYAAFDKRKEIEKEGNTDDYAKSIIKNSSKDNISNYKLIDVENIYKPVKENYNISSSDNITFAGNIIYLSPLLNEKMTENPFKLEEREYPVDFAYPISKKIIMQYTIPEGYVVDEFPKSTNFSLAKKAAQFQYKVSVVGNKIQVISIFKINQTIFQYDSYKALKNFYNLVIEKQKEQIVFKKKV